MEQLAGRVARGATLLDWGTATDRPGARAKASDTCNQAAVEPRVSFLLGGTFDAIKEFCTTLHRRAGSSGRRWRSGDAGKRPRHGNSSCAALAAWAAQRCASGHAPAQTTNEELRPTAMPVDILAQRRRTLTMAWAPAPTSSAASSYLHACGPQEEEPRAPRRCRRPYHATSLAMPCARRKLLPATLLGRDILQRTQGRRVQASRGLSTGRC